MVSQAAGRAGGRKRLLWAGAAGVLAVVVLVALAWSGAFAGSAGQSQDALFEVAEGPLTISVTESGTVQPKDQVIIKSEVEGTTAILYLIPEGNRVQKGDLLVQLDSSNLEDSKVDQQIRVQNAEASAVSSRENLAVVRNQAQSDVDKAELDLKFAGEDLKNYKDGEYPNQVKELEASINLAQEELQRAQDTLQWSSILYQEKYLSESELKADQLAVNKSQLDLELAQSKLALLKDYTYKRTLDELESNAKQAEMALERTVRKASANVAQAEANAKAAESEFNRQQDKLSKIEDQTKKTKIVAPTDGLVVYATSAQTGFRHFGTEPLDEGQQVRERQELIYLPTGSDFKAQVSVHESSLEKITVGLAVRITVDALPSKVFRGKVASIAPLPDARSMFMNPDLKVYPTEINIEGGANGLRSGMTCKAQIIVAQYPSAIYVPVQAIVQVKGKTTAYVQEGEKTEPRPVEIGLDDNRMVHIISGLNPGEMVLLNPPLEAGGATREPQPQEGTETQEPASVTREQPAASTPAESTAEPEAAAEQPADSQEPSSGPWQNLSEEERQKMRERFENMSEEERAAMRERMSQGQTQGQRGASE